MNFEEHLHLHSSIFSVYYKNCWDFCLLISFNKNVCIYYTAFECILYLNNDWHNILFPQVSTDAIAGGVTAAVVVILLCIGVAVFAIVYIQRRKKCSRKCSGKVEVARYASL